MAYRLGRLGGALVLRVFLPYKEGYERVQPCLAMRHNALGPVPVKNSRGIATLNPSERMGKFIIYTVLGTLATFAVIVHLSLLPYLMQLPGFADGVTPRAVFGELHAFLLTLALSWVAWWSVSGVLSVLLYGLGRFSAVVLFILSLGAVIGITIMIT